MKKKISLLILLVSLMFSCSSMQTDLYFMILSGKCEVSYTVSQNFSDVMTVFAKGPDPAGFYSELSMSYSKGEIIALLQSKDTNEVKVGYLLRDKYNELKIGYPYLQVNKK